MKQLNFLERARREHIPPDADEWDLHVFFQLEKEVIDKHLREIARAKWRECEGDPQKALQAGDDMVSQIAGCYEKYDEIQDERIYAEAARGNLERQSPTRSKIMTWRVAFCIAVLAETTVMIVQQTLTGDFNPFVLILAFLLGLGGFLQGQGIGNYFAKRWREDTKRAQPGERSGASWLQFGIGTALIVLISGIRGSGADETAQFALVFLVTFLFGEAVSICEALTVSYKSMHETLLAEMTSAQKWQANIEHHRPEIKNGYKQTYEGAVSQAQASGAQSSLSSSSSSTMKPPPSSKL